MAPDPHPDVLRLEAARPSAVSDAVAAAADPAVVVTATALLVSVRSATSPLSGLGWALFAIGFCVGLPYVALLVMLRQGTVTDRHLLVREQRRRPLAVAAVSVVTGFLLLLGSGAPRPLVALVAAMAAGLVAMSAVTHWYKASFHTGVVAGSAGVLALVFGPLTLVGMVPLTALVGWARVRSGRHAVGQVLVGGLVGAGSSLLVYPLVS
ncbi:MAG: phosphatase PAP2 family protein [Terracoccus sp.]